jgi:2,5-diketo-D-gluconate reductase B
MHPLLPQTGLRARARADDHTLVAYSPLSHGDVFDVPEIRSVAEKHDVSAARVTLAWATSKPNVAAVPKASSRAHLRDNLQATDLELDDDDVERIDAIDRRQRFIDPDGAPWNQ